MPYIDDYSGDASTNGRLTTAAPVYGVIEIAGDQDWFKTYLTAGTAYSFNQVQTPLGNTALLDSYLRLLYSNGQEITARSVIIIN